MLAGKDLGNGEFSLQPVEGLFFPFGFLALLLDLEDHVIEFKDGCIRTAYGVCLCLCQFFKEVRTVLDCVNDSLNCSESPDFLSITGQKDIRNPVAVELKRMGILRVFQDSGLEAFLCRLFITEGFRKQSDHAVTDGHGRKFASGEDEISDGNLLVNIVFYSPVRSLVMAADQYNVFLLGKLMGFLLVVGLTFGRKKDYM